MIDKFQMTKEQNLFVAKRNMVDYIWKSANIEGIAVTYPDTQSICDGMAVSGYTIDEINAVNDLKHAWQYLLQNIDEPLDLQFLCRLHREVGKFTVINAGSIRMESVSIGGTDWVPELPNEALIEAEIEQIQASDGTVTDKALGMYLLCARGQFFYDGNKRLAFLAANKVLIPNGAGVLAVPGRERDTFYKLLIGFYETENGDRIREFLYGNCIDGINFRQTEVMDQTM